MEANRKQETVARIRELRQSIDKLEAELTQATPDTRAQHEIVERLDQYIDAVDTKASSLKTFWRALKQEWRGR